MPSILSKLTSNKRYKRPLVPFLQLLFASTFLLLSSVVLHIPDKNTGMIATGAEANPLSYMVVGAGGVGGLISGFMSKAGKKVTTALRAGSAHSQAIEKQGGKLKLKLVDGSEELVPLRVISEAGDAASKHDVAIVATKAYSFDSVVPLLEKSLKPGSAVIPLENGMFAGDVLRKKLPGEIRVFDGNIYVTAYKSAPGEITQNHERTKIVYGVEGKTRKDVPITKTIDKDWEESHIKAAYTPDIKFEMFRKLSLISAASATSLKFDATAGAIRSDPKKLNYFKGLCEEQNKIAKAAKFGKDFDAKDNIDYMMNVDPQWVSSLHKDIRYRGVPGQDERDTMLFDVVRLARRLKVDTPLYEEVTQPMGLPPK